MTPSETKSESKRGRPHDAAGAQEAILNAAEEVFAEYGFAGARIDAIAKASGYNSSLIFHYFDDKLGLYREIVRRADKVLSALHASALASLFENEAIAEDATALRTLLETLVALYFDFVVAHPRFMRTLLWEQAAGWQTYAKIVAQFTLDEEDSFQKLFDKAYKAGLLRSNFAPMIQVSMILQLCLSYLAFIPIYEMALQPGETLTSSAAMASARDYVIRFVVNGMMVELPNEPKTTKNPEEQ